MPSFRTSGVSRKLFYCSLTIVVLASLAAASTLRTGSDILAAMQKNTSITSDITASVSMTQQKSGQGIKNLEMLYYRRDSDDAFLIVFKNPEADKGNGYLRVGENFWMYRRNTRTFQHVNRDENIGGTDAQGDDFEDRPITDLYTVAKDTSGAEKIQEEELGKIPVYRLEILAKVNDVDYPRKTLWVRRDNYLPLKELSYANSGALMQTAYFLKYTPVQGHFLAVEQIFIDEFEKGNRTKLNIGEIQHSPIAKEIFTKAYLENLSK
jgi:outer membrane lipoprotein-sorting protein